MSRGRRRSGREIHGIILLDKPLGMSSNKALQIVKRLFKAKKAGHTGSLDPLATGMLPLCFGLATKVSAYLLDSDKRYETRAKLGETTATQDAEGDILKVRDASGISKSHVLEQLPAFRGEIEQIPPMYSALKHQGERLYKLARQGKEVERPPRQITIHDIELTDIELPHVDLSIHCSKGTYVRTIVEDLGEALGCGAHVNRLRRTHVGPFEASHMVTLDQLDQAAEQGLDVLDTFLLPIETALDGWHPVQLDADSAYYIRQGQAVRASSTLAEGLMVTIFSPEGFIGIGKILDDGRVAPKKML